MLAKKVLELYANKQWTQGALALNKYAFRIMPWEEGAVCFCLAGAAIAVSQSRLSAAALAEELKFDGYQEMIQWNDAPGRTFEQVKLRLEAACYKPDHNGVMGGDFGQSAGSL